MKSDLFNVGTIPSATTRALRYSAEFKVVTIRETPPPQGALDTPQEIVSFYREEIVTAPGYEPDKEQLHVICLNTKLRMIGWNLVSLGTVCEALAHPREIFRPAIMSGATNIILLHNHPSGDSSPSEADRRLTVRVDQSGKLLQLTLLDHLIVGEPTGGTTGYFSFREAGLI